MNVLESMENEILKHLYCLGIQGLNSGWEREFILDKKAVNELYRIKLLDKSNPPGLIRLSELGVGTVLFGFHKAGQISKLL